MVDFNAALLKLRQDKARREKLAADAAVTERDFALRAARKSLTELEHDLATEALKALRTGVVWCIKKSTADSVKAARERVKGMEDAS